MKKTITFLYLASCSLRWSCWEFSYYTRQTVRESKNYCRRKVFGTYLLSEDRTVSVNETNIVLITEGTVSMESADCPDQICVHHQRIKRSGESIICLPNKVVVSIEGGGEENLTELYNSQERVI